VNFLLLLIELFSLAVTAEALRCEYQLEAVARALCDS